jgi:signal transduction histidine kinase
VFRKGIICLLLFLGYQDCLRSQEQHTVVLSQADELVMMGKDVMYLEDTSNHLSVQQADSLYGQGKFSRHSKTVFTGPSSTQSVWFRLAVRNLTGHEVWLDAGSSYSAWYIDFYRADSNGRYSQPVLTGSLRPDINKEYPVNNYWLRLASAQDTTIKVYYLKILSGRTPEYTLEAGTLPALHDHKTTSDYLTAGFVGLMIVMILYNFFLFTATRDSIYCIYASYLVTALFSFTYFYGYPLFPKYSWFWEYNYIWYAPGYVFVSWFSIRYLDLKKYPWLYRIILAETGCLALIIPLLNGMGVPVKALIPFNQPLLLLYSFTFLVTGFYLYAVRKQKIARYYFAGWSVEAISMIISILVLRGEFPFNAFTRSILYTGISIEMVMFSFALADRVNLLRRENLQLMTRQNVLLEQKVADRTRQLEEQSASLQSVNDTKDKLFAIIGHDLRGPVGGLKSILDMFTAGVLPQQAFLELTPKLRDNVQNVYTTLENLLQWSQAQMNGLLTHPQTIRVFPLVEEVSRLFTDSLTQKMIRIENLVSNDAQVYSDADHLKLILRNLFSNAIKFTQSGGHITVSAGTKEKDTVIVVTDNGIGMDHQQLQRLFVLSAAFSTQGTSGEKGTGLGLLLCKELAEKNNGFIRVESRLNEGTSFFIHLPSLPA